MISVQDVLASAVKIQGEIGKVAESKKMGELKRLLSDIPDAQIRNDVSAMLLTLMGGCPVVPNGQVVVLLHGIRTRAEWQACVSNELTELPHTIVYPIGYGFLDVFRFWFPFWFRNGPIIAVTEDLREIHRKHPAATITVIAHSFGTYVISKILGANDRYIKIDRLLFCGSVVPESYKWSKLMNVPSIVINDYGTKDVWPVIATVISWGYGPTGTFGFKRHEVKDRAHEIGHSGFFDVAWIRTFWVPFVASGQCVPSPQVSGQKPASYLLSVFPVLPIKSLLAVVIVWYFIQHLWA